MSVILKEATDAKTNTSASFDEQNRTYLQAELEHLKLTMHRRILWLRHKWNSDPFKSYPGLVISDDKVDHLLTDEDESVQARFYREDPDATALGQHIEEVRQYCSALGREMVEANTPAVLDGLVRLFGLSAFGKQVLILCFAVETDPDFGILCAYMQDDAARKYVTAHLAIDLFASGEESKAHAAACFLPGAPLFRFGLVREDASSGPTIAKNARPLQLDSRIRDYMLNVHHLDERIVDIVRPMPPALLASDQHELLDRMAAALSSPEARKTRVLVNFVGPDGSGKRVLAGGLTDRLGLMCLSLDLKKAPSIGIDWGDLTRLLTREAILSGFALYLDMDAVDPADKTAATLAEDCVEHLSSFLIVGSSKRLSPSRPVIASEVPAVDARAQHEIWTQALGSAEHCLNGEIDAIVQQFDFGPETIPKVVTSAQGKTGLRSSGEESAIGAEDLWEACRDHASADMESLAARIDPCFTFEDIVLPDDAREQLREIAAQVLGRPTVYETWGFGEKLSRGKGIGVLFSGVSGTGKTMASEILAAELKLDLYRIDLAGVVSKYIGETEKNLKKVFDSAEQSGAILLFDEADALFGKRTEVKDSHDRYANIEVNYLLQRMEDYRGLAILTTNRRSALDRAFLRRLRFLVEFPFPDALNRGEIWRKVFPAQSETTDLDYDSLARMELAGGNIKTIVLNAAFLAAAEKTPIAMKHVMHAARREYAKLDKLITEAEFGAYYDGVG